MGVNVETGQQEVAATEQVQSGLGWSCGWTRSYLMPDTAPLTTLQVLEIFIIAASKHTTGIWYISTDIQVNNQCNI